MTREKIKNQVRDELKCPAEFIRYESEYFSVFDDMTEAANHGDEDTTSRIMHDIKVAYDNYCVAVGLDFTADNRQKEPHFFFL